MKDSTVTADGGCLCIAITGGIAAGKSTVASAFVAVGAMLIDADTVARELVEPGQPALVEIAEAFGPGALDATGALDRRAMRERIFTDAHAKETLESILHPRVRVELRARAQACTEPYCLLAIPLLVESVHAYDWVDRVIVVDVSAATQLARLMQRDSTTPDEARRALAAQASREQRLSLADDVIDNSFALADLRAPVQRLHQLYGHLAQIWRRPSFPRA